MLTTRLLPFREWRRLAGTELEDVIPHLPLDAQVIVVEQQGAIVGCWAVMRYVHVEGVWIHPDHRKKAGVARRLLSQMGRVARRIFGAEVVLTGALSPDVASFIQRVGGQRLPGEHYVIPIHEDS